MTSWCARHTVTPPPYTVTAKLLYNFLTAFFFPKSRYSENASSEIAYNEGCLYSVAAVLYIQFVLHVMLFRMLNMFCTSTLALSILRVCAVPSMAVFCSSLISCFPGMLLWYFMNYCEMVPVDPIIIIIIIICC